MGLGDLMPSSRNYHSTVTASVPDDDRRDSELAPPPSTSSGGNASSTAADSAAAGDGGDGGGATSMAYLPQTVVLCELRHDAFEASVPTGPCHSGLVSRWRPKDRTKTGCGALVLCLNISVDPPDVIKISPCARMECWIDPFSMAPQKALESIGKTLKSQYERWQPKAPYKRQLDPTVDEVKKLCTNCRRYAKSERVLFHYNGHGVPKPTPNGEIWVFNKSYTQYIPLPISDLDSWLKTPSIYVFDCSAAGMIVNSFIELHERSASNSSGSTRDCILLAACEAHETLPQSAEFPADVFTSCLTTPIKMALRWFCTRSLLHESLDYALIDKVPGLPNDRKTLLGELNWIFTAVTDTIAWNVLPRELFQRLFRQDLLIVSLFRNFLLAERIMRSANCSPVSHPTLPPTHQHHMWDAWDMAAELCLSQLPSLVEDPNAEYQPSTFFTDQLTAFEVWLDHGSERKKPPEQLPIVLQVLLSQSHRFRALVLLGRFLDMGPWAVDLALSVGIFPYVLKLLLTTTPELRQILVFIWTKILALDKSCQVDLVKDGGHIYFIKFLDSMEAYPEQRAMAAFVLAVIVDGHRRGQEACIEAGLIHVCLKHLQSSSPIDSQTEPLFLQWLCLCLGKLCEDFSEAQTIGLQEGAPSIYARLLSEPQPEVRAAAVFSLGTLLDVGFHSCIVGGDEECDDDDDTFRAEVSIVQSLLSVALDGSPLVRAEVAVALARFAFGHNKPLESFAAAYWKPQTNSLLNSLPSLANINGSGGSYPGQNQHAPHGSILSSQIGPVLRVGNDSSSVVGDWSVTSSSPPMSSGIMHGSLLSDTSSHHSVSGTLHDGFSNGVVNHTGPRPLDNALYSQCVLAMRNLAKDPSPRIANLGRHVLSIIGIEQVAAKPLKSTSVRISEPAAPPNLAGLARSSSWFDMNGGHSSLTFRTPPVSPPRPSYITGMRRVSSLEFRPHLMSSPDSGLADPLLGSSGASGTSDRSFLPQSTLYNWSCGHFSKPLLTAADDSEDLLARREEREKIALEHIAKCQHSAISRVTNPIAKWDIKGTQTATFQPFSHIVIAADENEHIRIWNHKEATLLNSFDNHDFPDKGISKLCLVNELDDSDSLLLAASSDGNIRIWKDYSLKGKQKLVTAFSSIHGHKPGVRSLNAVVDWQQQSGYLYASGEISSIMLWDLDREQLLNSIPSSSDCSISALAASQVHGGQFAAGFVDGSVRLYDVRTPEILLVHLRGSLTALAAHKHAPIIASGSAKQQFIEVFNLEGDQLGTIRHYPTLMAQKIGAISCLAFHPYQLLLAAGAADTCVSIYADDHAQAR
ncbi:PREDICTED: regulatory-associated protein of TOR 1-like isoform X2 [Lupinus angustifolius]|uniref:regulatory-associated protein of TOR 1-like isoform X2 n=1 Tax=Lupinus angustifolius TaxID=3871 RepID=UPI00092F8BD3|nr:PREDICTED: regulatory-associated protein of TOR 1-like isoform X2 [Lupinus angustifolius]